VAVDPSYAKAYSRLGLAYYHLGRYEEAITEGYSKAVELDPSNASAQKDLANAKKKLEAFANSSAAAPPPAAGAPTDPFAAMMAGLGGGGGGGGGMPDMGNLMGMMQDPAIQQMAQQMMGGMGGAGGGGVPDLSAMMSAMGGGSGAEQNAVLSVPFSFETQSVAKTGSGQTSIELSSTNPPCFTHADMGGGGGGDGGGPTVDEVEPAGICLFAHRSRAALRFSLVHLHRLNVPVLPSRAQETATGNLGNLVRQLSLLCTTMDRHGQR
jgi:hypothetical protein